MSDTRRPSDVRQVELVDAALHLIATRGIAALTTRSLAEQVGLSSGAIFRHFPSLEAVLEAVVSRVEVVLDSTYPEPALPPAEKLERFIEARSTAVGKQVGILRLVQSEQFLLALPKNGSERLSACEQRTRSFITECLREGQEAGQIRADLPADTLAPIVMGTVQMLALSTAGARQRTSESQRVRESMMTLLRPPPITKSSRK